MPQFTQNDHPLQICQSPLGTDVLLVDSLDGEEGMSSLFEFRLRLRSHNGAIDAAQIIGQSITVSLDRVDGSRARRYFNGIVTRFESFGRIDGDLCLYSVVLRPWLWLLSQTSDCRIFQQQSALDIVKSVLSDAGSYPVEVRAAAPPPRDYCVQYNESDFAFVSRLLEDEGIFYYFRHENGKHTLVIGDDISALADSAEGTVSFKETLSGERGADRLKAWSHGYELRPGKWAHSDYNFQTPDSNLLSQAPAGKVPGMSKYEVFEFPGDHADTGAGQKRATIRANQTVFEQDCVQGQSLVETFAAGCRFKVSDHHSPSEKGKAFLLTTVHHQADQSGSWNDARETNERGAVYSNWFSAVPADTKIRPARRTSRPRIWGPQTALVVGPAGEEIFTDKFGRVKVQFYWDRYGKKDDHSSCWVRVAFLSAGGGWGAVAIPRIGYEVVVQFIDGDPDRPLVTGCVYNSRNMPPLSDAGTGSTPPDMPGAKTMTTLRSQSFGKTGGYNEITMNDTQGAETLFIKAQYDEIHKVGHDRKDSVINDVTTTIGNNETVSVGKDRSTTIGNNDTLSISNNHSAKIGNNHSTSIQGNRSLTITGNDSVSVTGNRDESMTGNLSETGMQVTITGQTMLTLQCGGSTIQMTPASISIKAPMVMIN